MRQLDVSSYVMGIDNFEGIKARLAKAIAGRGEISREAAQARWGNKA